ncbi:MAG: hypothetical protein ABIO67_01505 [Mycobacteriales bacterium]
MKQVVLAFLRRTAVGAVLICLGVPLLQNQVINVAQAQRSGPVLSVAGDVTGLEPGKPGRLVFTVRNDGDAAAAIQRMTTAVITTAVGCSLSVDTWTGSLEVPAGGQVRGEVTVRIRGARCDGAQWDLDYKVS